MQQGRIELPDEAVAGAGEDRSAPRFTLLIRVAKLVSPRGEFIAVIRDVSDSGISLRMFHPLPAEGPFTLELQTGERHAIEPVWSRGNEAGFRFSGNVDIVRLIAEAGRYPKRQLRLEIGFEIELALLGRRVPATVSNISQQGARIACDERLAIAQPLRIVSEFLPEVRAKVRWRKDATYGLVFDDTFSLNELAVFAAGAQDPVLLAETHGGAALRR
ncbi:PilZ domain-containing protein [Tsuneonella sp. HG094]